MKINRYTYSILFALVLFGCSQEKNTIVNRSYHNLTARYNGFFNGRLALQDAHKAMEEAYTEDYTQRLPVFISTIDEVVQPVYPQLERAITKTSMVVDRHSMDISGKEYCNWIDDAWLVMGEAQFLKGEYVQAKQIFDFTKRKYPDPKTKQISYLYLGKIYMEQEEYQRAGDQFRKLSLADGFPEKMLGELYAVKTDFYLRQNRLDDAIQQLEQSIAYSKKRQVKTRRMFLLAQLYKEIGEGSTSSDLYAQVIKRNPDYVMAFYAKINRALAYDVTGGNSQEIKDILFKMIKDAKNAEFLDQIYYALAELELKEGNEEQGIEYLHLATEKSVLNGNAKGLAYYRLAEIYFAKPAYAVAQTYYDSTVAFLSTEHPDYDLILARANSLTQMMRDITIVETEDSLQAFALLSEEDQERQIEMRIEDFIQAEKDAERQKELAELQNQNAKFNQNNQFNQNMKSGDWYFYNPGAIGFGASEFKKIWGGNRKNEDNWRRSDKTSNAPLLIADEDGILEEDTIDGADDPKNPNYYKKSIPNTEEKLARSHALIIEALYDLGLVYKEQMNDYPPAVETFEELISRYDSSKYHVTSHYQLYLMYAEMGDQAKSEYHKNQILTKYPQSDYAQVILNPSFAASDMVKDAEVEKLYQEAYTYFEQGFYRRAYELGTLGLEKHPNSSFQPQFKFLEALCLGYIDSEARMLAELEVVKSKYAGSEVGKEAEEIIEYFKNGRSFGNELAEANKKIEEEEALAKMDQYKYDVGASHNFVIVVSDTMDTEALKRKVSDFNRKYFSTKGFKTSMILLKESKAMIIVSNVGYATKAIDYFTTFKGATDFKKLFENKNPIFVISYDNYAQFYKDQNTEAYMMFFEENYLKGK